jgi:hypothetical protein
MLTTTMPTKLHTPPIRSSAGRARTAKELRRKGRRERPT